MPSSFIGLWVKYKSNFVKNLDLSSLNDVYTSFVRPIKEGGGFNFENILTLCIDCNKVLDSNLQKSASINSLKLYDELLGFIVD